MPDGRLDRGGEHDRLGGVQHHRGPRGGGRRVPLRRADHDDRPRRDPPGAAGPRRGRGAARRWARAPGGSPPSSPTTPWTATSSGPGPPTTAIHDAVAIAHLVVPDLVAVARYHVTVDTTDGPARGRTVCDGLPYRLRRDGRDAQRGRRHRHRPRAVHPPARRRLREAPVTDAPARDPGHHRLRPGPRRRPGDHARAGPPGARRPGDHDDRRQLDARQHHAQRAAGAGAARPDGRAGRGRAATSRSSGRSRPRPRSTA